ncbi:MAG TPA: efflux RND transporter permease subunit, partial [Pirellulales bacterium]|nr:efflux RND transporter permease subunit [Pirellulales bacterium]
SLAGITISIGILVDQAIVMVENATHALKEHFGDRPVTGDIRELVIPACRTVGRPIFFSVMIMLISFIPVFMLSGREGKYFHPLAFTKSFALLGVALLSITLVPALIPTFIKGRLRSEEENWIVRSFINIYKPLLTWALPRRNLVMWMFAALLILAAGMFPLQALVGQGASEIAWRQTFLWVFAGVTMLTVRSITGRHGPGLPWFLGDCGLALVALGLMAVAGVIVYAGIWSGQFNFLVGPFWLIGTVNLFTVAKWLVITAAAVPLAVMFFIGARVQRLLMWQTIALASLVLIGLWAYKFNKIGVAFMPALDEGTTLDMPITVPRASVTQSADDLKARDALLRGFPEVESVIGKAGRANTPTDPSPLDMVETFVNFRPKKLWPKRVLKFNDAQKQIEAVLALLEERGYVASPKSKVQSPKFDEDRATLVNDATQKALERFDETMRELALLRYEEFKGELEAELTRFAVEETVRQIGSGRAASAEQFPGQSLGDVPVASSGRADPAPASPGGAKEFSRGRQPTETKPQPPDSRVAATESDAEGPAATRLEQFSRPSTVGSRPRLNSVATTRRSAEALVDDLTTKYGPWLAKNAALEDVTQLARDVARSLKERGLIDDEALALQQNDFRWGTIKNGVMELLGGERRDFVRELLAAVERRRNELWQERVKQVNWELFDEGTRDFCWYALEEVVKGAKSAGSVAGAAHAAEAEKFATAALNEQLGKPFDAEALESFVTLREELQADFRKRVFFWPRQTGPKGDLVDDEMGRVLQVPGWSNIFTQPIINRIEMLSTGVRTDIGVKVFGPDLDTIDRVCKEVEAALKPINGARDVIAAPFMGKGYLEVDIDRENAARYGISVEDIENEIEVALAGKAITYTVEARDRFPVRIRYARSEREDEESVRRLLVSPGSMAAGGDAGGAPMASAGGPANETMNTSGPTAGHTASPGHATRGKSLIPLSAVADVRVAGGPAMIKSENSQLVNYVTLNVRGRDVVGFVDEAQRVVAQKVKLPEGVHIEWSGEFEHQVRAAETLRIVFPIVIVLIFVILYLTYNDLMDAVLMMLAVPEALAGGAFFMYLFPKIMQGWEAPPMDFSVAVWVGFIACFGMATETGIIMLVYLREAIEKRGGLENIESLAELRQAVIEGAVHRLRPKLLTEGVAIIAIFPMVFAKGVGGEILAPMALPVLGGLLISDEVVDLFLPVRFYWVRRGRWLKLQAETRRRQEGVNLTGLA